MLLGPVFGGITGFIVGIWPGITFGNFFVPPFKALTGILVAILSKKTRPGVAVFVGYLPEAFLTYLTLAVLKIPYGLPLPVIYTILLKAFAEFIILAILMEIIMRNNGIKRFLESKVGFYTFDIFNFCEKKQLEIFLSNLKEMEDPNMFEEQYTTPGDMKLEIVLLPITG